MQEKGRSYRIARSYFSLFELLCYLGLAGDALALVIGFSKLGDPYARVQGAFMVVASIAGAFFLFFMIVMTQVGRAVVDTAESGREMLQLMRQATPVPADGPEAAAQGPGTLAARTETPNAGGPKTVETYRGFDIVQKDELLHVPRLGDTGYQLRYEARQAIDAALGRDKTA